MKKFAFAHGFLMTDSIREYCHANMEQAVKGFNLPDHCEIVTVLEPKSASHRKGNLYVCKIRISGLSVAVEREHLNLYGAIENACDLLRRLLGKMNQRKQNRRSKPRFAA